MLRISPDGGTVWVQTGSGNTNVVLDAETLTVLETAPTGRGPVTAAFQPNSGRYGLVTHLTDPFVLLLDQETGAALDRIDVGGAQANASFTPDGSLAFVTVPENNEIAVIDPTARAVVGRIPTGTRPAGIVLLPHTSLP